MVTRHCLSKKFGRRNGACAPLGVLLVVAPTVPAGESLPQCALGYLFSRTTHQRADLSQTGAIGLAPADSSASLMTLAWVGVQISSIMHLHEISGGRMEAAQTALCPAVTLWLACR